MPKFSNQNFTNVFSICSLYFFSVCSPSTLIENALWNSGWVAWLERLTGIREAAAFTEVVEPRQPNASSLPPVHQLAKFQNLRSNRRVVVVKLGQTIISDPSFSSTLIAFQLLVLKTALALYEPSETQAHTQNNFSVHTTCN